MALVALNPRVPGLRQSFESEVRDTLHDKPDVASKLLEAYNFGPNTSDQEALLSVVQFLTDTLFYAPSIRLADAFESSYVCHFNEPNPWEGQFKGYATHFLEICLLFQNYNTHLSQGAIATGRALARDVIAFVAGSPANPRWKDTNDVTVYGPSTEGISRKTARAVSLESGRTQGFLELAEGAGGLDVLHMIATRVFKG